MRQEVVLALLAKEPSHGYELRARLRQALGPLGGEMNEGQVYVTLSRLEKAGLVAPEPAAGVADRPDRKMYALTAAGQQRVAGWLAEVSWPKPDLTEFHLKLIAAAAAGLADPLAIVDAQRRELLRRRCRLPAARRCRHVHDPGDRRHRDQHQNALHRSSLSAPPHCVGIDGTQQPRPSRVNAA